MSDEPDTLRMTSVEQSIAWLHGDFAGQSAGMDRIQDRLEQIERRLDLTSTAV